MQHNTVHAYLIKKIAHRTSQRIQSHAFKNKYRAGVKHNEEALSKIETAKGIPSTRTSASAIEPTGYGVFRVFDSRVVL